MFPPIDERLAAADSSPEVLLNVLAVHLGRRPLLMIAEDIHWVDPSTEEILGTLIDWIRDLANRANSPEKEARV